MNQRQSGFHFCAPPADRRAGRAGGGPNAQSERTKQEALERAEALRAVMAELSGLSATKAAAELNKRKVETPMGGKWHAVTVKRVRDRLAGRALLDQATKGEAI